MASVTVVKALAVSSVLFVSFAIASAQDSTNVTTTNSNEPDLTPASSENKGGNLECFVCNSADNPRCDDPFNSDDKDYPIDTESTCKYCRKYLQKVQKDIERIQRTCASDKEKALDDEEGCTFSTGTNAVQTEICTCNGNLCNGASESKSAVTVLASAALVVLAKLLC